MDDFGTGMLLGFFAGAVFAGCIAGGCTDKHWRDDAINLGHAKYALTKPNKSEATFTWNTNCGVAK
jgi:hypothetical protein